MDRFVAMLWDTQILPRTQQVEAWTAELQRASDRWRVALDAPGLRVLSFVHRGDAPVVTRMTEAKGVVIGVLFQRGAEKQGRVKVLDAQAAARVVATSGDHLISDYWGNYVAVWRERESGAVMVLRDPCGAVPCYVTCQQGVDLLFAHAEDVAALDAIEFSIDWTSLQVFVLHPYFVTEHTGLHEAKEVLPGERLIWAADRETTRSWAWKAVDFAAEPDLCSPEQARTKLREVTESCMSAWGAEYSKIVVSASGGLDSSIVLNLLRRVSQAEITARHYAGVSYEGHEQRFARLAAEHAGVALVDQPLDPAHEDLSRALSTPRLARPSMQLLANLADDAASALGERLGIDCFMSGEGGDSLFLQRVIGDDAVFDHLRIRGLRSDTLRVAYDSAALQQRSLYRVLRQALGALTTRRSEPSLSLLKAVKSNPHVPVPADAIDKIEPSRTHHPWFSELGRLPRGKATHVQSIIALYRYYAVRGHALTRDSLNPLFSQPIVELVLRLPTYILAYGGIDRRLERETFNDIIPHAIAARTSKGGIDHYLSKVMQGNVNFLRPLLLEGELLRHRLVDPAKVEHLLSQQEMASSRAGVYLYALIAAEVWTQRWRLGAQLLGAGTSSRAIVGM